MGAAQWWFYDLLIISIVVICIWNGARGGAVKAASGLAIGIVSCLVAFMIAGPVSDAVYGRFFHEACQQTITDKLRKADISGNIRGELENHGIYLPYNDEQLADMIEEAGSDSSALKQAASLLGIDADDINNILGKAFDKALESSDDVIPAWAADSIVEDGKKFRIDSAADSVAAILRDDYSEAAEKIENAYVKPALTSFIRIIILVGTAALLSMVLRILLLALPRGRSSSIDSMIGAAMGAARAFIYIYLVVLLVSSISSIQNGEYPFYSKNTIDQTYLFRIFYDMWR